MEPAGATGSVRWGTAVALTLAVMFLSIFDAIPLVALPLAVLFVALPAESRWKWIGMGTAIWVAAVALPGSTLSALSRGWGLLLGGAFLLSSAVRPRWGVLPRALLAVVLAGAAGLGGLALTGAWPAVDRLVQSHLQTVASLTLTSVGTQAAGSAWVGELGEVARRMARLQWTLFPAVLALQSLAALALASWWVARSRRREETSFRLRPLREFRFNDQLVWLAIAGLVLLLLPFGAAATRVGVNALFFMGALYALRGLGVFLFLAGGAPSIGLIVLGVLAAIILNRVVLTAALLVGLGDTWLDIRGRAKLAPRS